MVENVKKYCLILAYVLIFTAFILILNVFKENIYVFGIKGLGDIVETISVNIGFNKEISNENIEVCFDSYCMHPDKTSYKNTFHTQFGEKYIVSNFRVKFSDLISAENIDYIYIYSGSRNYHYSKDDIKQLL